MEELQITITLAQADALIAVLAPRPASEVFDHILVLVNAKVVAQQAAQGEEEAKQAEQFQASLDAALEAKSKKDEEKRATATGVAAEIAPPKSAVTEKPKAKA